ncbi:MAG: enoyl-CoA hydratase/isomerase family protein [Alphaproteobacteria bacterium]|nr:enoyl-CoA hydratase/isomerase family protein [Alphaproteobacteria bacterium]
MADDEKILVQRSGAVAWIVMNNPAKRNAFDAAMRARFPGILNALGADPSVRVVVLRGAGTKAFTSGADIAEFDRIHESAGGVEAFLAAGRVVDEALRGVEKPLLAMIDGVCFGGGILYAMRCDMRIASAEASFAVPAAKLGIGYSYPGISDLVDLIGPSRTADMIFTGRAIDAEEALGIGLVDRVFPRATLEAEMQALAETIAANAPLTIRAAKASIRERLKPDSARDLERCRRLTAEAYASEDYREGRRAFREKRKPSFQGV